MADATTSNISIALYRYLCLHIVGTEDHVKTIRRMHAVRDDMASSKKITTITSGSFGEGLEMRGSDLDIMYVFNSFEVYENKPNGFNPDITYFSMETDDIKPGFTQLRIDYYMSQHVSEHNGKHYLPNNFCKQSFWPVGTIQHGPCITDKNETFDHAICFHCKTWVSPAVHWITRSSNLWPSDDVKQSIIQHGVLFVPIGVKGSPKEDLEWRISFSVGEKLLINTFTHTQLLCYSLLKVLLKDVIANYSECKDLLCSYFLKTIIFWISEELPQSVWKPHNLIPCFVRCLSRLVYCVEHSICLHYFIQENNMFENKIEGRVQEILLKKLNTLYSYGWRCILFSDQISNFEVSMWNFPIPQHTFYVNDVEKILKSNLFILANLTFNNVPARADYNIYKKNMIQKVLRKQSSIPYVLYIYYMSMYCNRLAQNIPLDSTNCNKNRYKQYKSCLSTLLTNVYHDAVSGWLMLASLFYKTKQYRKALYIIDYSLSKCTPEKLYRYMSMSDINYQLFKLQSFKRENLMYLEKTMQVDNINLLPFCSFTPDELQIVEWKELLPLPSTAYACFLNFLCHYHLNNEREYFDSLQCLQLVIKDNYLMIGRRSKDRAIMLLRIALHVLDDNKTA